MVNESAKTPVGKLLTPGEGELTPSPRDRKRTFSERRPESLIGKCTPSQPILAADASIHGKQHSSRIKKGRSLGSPTGSVKQVLNLVHKLSNDELSQVVGSILKRKKKRVQPVPSPRIPVHAESRRSAARLATTTPFTDGIAIRSPPEPQSREEKPTVSATQRDPHLKQRSGISIEDLKEQLANPLRPSGQNLDTLEGDLAHDLLQQAFRQSSCSL